MSLTYTSETLQLTTANQTVYTVPDTADWARIEFGTCNNIGADTTITLWVVPDGSVAGDTNQFMTAKTVQSATPNPMDAITGMILNIGDSIVAVAAANSRLNLYLSIVEVTNA